MTLFSNLHYGSDVTIDLDVFFSNFVRPASECPSDEKPGITLNTVRERLRRMVEIIGSDYSSAYYRRSSRDHVHVRLKFKYPLSVLDGFMIRAWMMDDQTRLSLDLARYLMTGDLHGINRCFDEKAESGEVKRAGPWIPLHIGKEGFSCAELEDWNNYIDRCSHNAQSELDFC